jgi:hypothetical protein
MLTKEWEKTKRRALKKIGKVEEKLKKQSVLKKIKKDEENLKKLQWAGKIKVRPVVKEGTKTDDRKITGFYKNKQRGNPTCRKCKLVMEKIEDYKYGCKICDNIKYTRRSVEKEDRRYKNYVRLLKNKMKQFKKNEANKTR